MADVTWRSATEHLSAEGVPALLVTIDSADAHRVYFDAAGDPMQLAKCCATVIGMLHQNPGLAALTRRVLEDNDGTGSLRVPERD